MTLPTSVREKRAEDLAFDIITELIACPDLTTQVTFNRLREFIRRRVYRLSPHSLDEDEMYACGHYMGFSRFCKLEPLHMGDHDMRLPKAAPR